MDIQKTIANLNQNGFEARLFASADVLKEAVIETIGTRSVGVGGSMSVAELGLLNTLKANGNELFARGYSDKSADEILRGAMTAETYLSSTNAITEDGYLLNIDGTGNRVAAMLFGPETVIVVAGTNKIAENIDAARKRIKMDCCPKNAVRLKKTTPCALTGICTDCHNEGRMCNAYVTLERPTRHVKHFYVFILDGVLGW